MRLRRTRPKQIRKCNGEPVLLMTVLDADSERGRRIRNEEAVVTPRLVCPIAATLPFECVSGESWPHGSCSGRFDIGHQSVKSSFLSGGIAAFARSLALFSPFLRIYSSLEHRKLPSAHSEPFERGQL
jgi:hypothetical protein